MNKNQYDSDAVVTSELVRNGEDDEEHGGVVAPRSMRLAGSCQFTRIHVYLTDRSETARAIPLPTYKTHLSVRFPSSG